MMWQATPIYPSNLTRYGDHSALPARHHLHVSCEPLRHLTPRNQSDKYLPQSFVPLKLRPGRVQQLDRHIHEIGLET